MHPVCFSATKIFTLVPLVCVYLQMISEFEAECQKVAADQGLSLPALFSAQNLFNIFGQAEFNKPVLDAAAILRRHGMLLLCCEIR